MPDPRSVRSFLSLLVLLGLALGSAVGAERLDAEPLDAERLDDPPFALDAELRRAVDDALAPRGDDARRTARLLEWIFDDVGLEYARHPTRDAAETFRAGEGNCLSFVNLFVGVGRHLGLHPIYVAVRDQERWDRDGDAVLSQGHVVAGLYLDGALRTFDFLPYRAKTYRHLEPMDDRTAAAHVLNNRGVEALLLAAETNVETTADETTERIATARGLFERAVRLAPHFVEAANNLGVWHLRHGDGAEAELIWRRALERRPESLPVLTNLARWARRSGDPEEAAALLDRADEVRHRNPYFFLLRADLALERDAPGDALEALRDALALKPDLPDVHLGLVRAYLALGRVETARRHLERARKIDPRHPGVRSLEQLLSTPAKAGGE